MATVVVVGEVVLDRFIHGQQTVDVAGGSAANTALALHAAGHHSSLRARYSTDSVGEYLYAAATELGLDVSAAVRTDDPGTLVEILLSDEGVPSYSFHMDGTADWQWREAELATALPAGCEAVVTGSLASVLSPGCDALAAWTRDLTERGITLGYDPNARPSALAAHDADVIRGRITQWVSASTVVKVSDEDLAWIAPGQSPQEVVAQWSTWGPQLVVLTGGPQGAWAMRNGSLVVHVNAPEIDVVDTVGAGDTLMAWLIGGLMDAPESKRYSPAVVIAVLDRAVRAAAVTCTRQGCVPPTPDDVM